MAVLVRSVNQAFAVMRFLAGAGQSSLSEVTRAVAISPSSGLNLLRTLVDEGVVVRDDSTRRYRLADDWAKVAGLERDRGKSVLKQLLPPMKTVAMRFGATIGLWQVAPRRRVVLVGAAQSDLPMRIQLADGQRQPLGSGAVGRALAAHQKVSEQELARRYSQVRWSGTVSLANYVREVRLAEQLGYAIDFGGAYAGVCSVAAVPENIPPGFIVSGSVLIEDNARVKADQLGKVLSLASTWN